MNSILREHPLKSKKTSSLSSLSSHKKPDITDREWFYKRFVIPQKCHGIMNPKSFHEKDAKYNFRHTPLSFKQLEKSFDSKPRRFGSKTTLWSWAVVPMHREKDSATFSIADLDSGGPEAIERLLSLCRKHQLWAFVQSSESEDHSGGHLWIPSEKELPSGLLLHLAELIQKQLPYDIDPYPKKTLLRLPLMPHLRHPSGKPQRLPITTTDGLIIDTTDPDKALKELREAWKENSAEKITAAIKSLTPDTHVETQDPSLPQPKPKLRRQAVKTHSRSKVINWYLSHHDLSTELASAGNQFKGTGIYTCPWHDDKRPSLFVYVHPEKNEWVCNCLSQHSGCPASIHNGHFDSFNLYCYQVGLSPSEAVKAIAEEHGLGKGKRRPALRTPKPKNERKVEEHFLEVEEKRKELKTSMHDNTAEKGVVLLFDGTPGVGKSFIGAQEAIEYHLSGKRVAVCIHTIKAAQQWEEDLGQHGFRWRSRLELCTCYEHTKTKLQKVAELGYTLPSCTDEDCPYQRQKSASTGKIVIYQHNHLWLQGGKLVLRGGSGTEEPVDLIIIDENPRSSLQQEQTVSQTELTQLLTRMPENDPAYPLLKALLKVGAKARHCPGRQIISFLQEETNQRLSQLLQQAKQSKFTQVQIKLDQESLKKINELPPVFFGKMFQALEHDFSKGRSDLVSFAQDNEKIWKWHWHRRHIPLEKAPPLFKPLVFILDGSAHEEIYKRLFPGWEIKTHKIEVPFSPLVNLIQYQYVPNTRRLAREPEQLQRIIKKIAYELNELDLLCDGGISYLQATKELEKNLGGTWYHYQGQRGLNGLKGAPCTVIVGAPTLPPQALERQARALFTDDEEPINTTWHPSGTPGYHVAEDPRLQLVNEMETKHELYQSVQRSRPILATTPQTILLMTTWDLSEFGIQPDEIRAALHGHDARLRDALPKYQERLQQQRATLFEEKLRCKKRGEITNGGSDLKFPLPPPPSSFLKEGVESGGLSFDVPSELVLYIYLTVCYFDPFFTSFFASAWKERAKKPRSRKNTEEVSIYNMSTYGGGGESLEECVGCGSYFDGKGGFETCVSCRVIYGEEGEDLDGRSFDLCA